MTVTVETTIDIEADPQAVWDVLTDFPAYPDWNPFIDRIEGRPEVGARLVVHLAGNGGRGMTFRPRVLAAAGEHFSGVLVALLKGTTKDSGTGFEAFNQALKQRVERTHVAPRGPRTSQPDERP